MSARKTEKSEASYKRASNLFPGGVNSPVRAFKSVGGNPFTVDYGKGPLLVDIDGNRYIDYVCSWGPLVLGHAHPLIVEAIKKQAEKGTSYGASCALECELAELIKTLMPNIDMLRFVNSGTEAGMSVLRLARGFTGRQKIVKFAGCYHGHADSLLVKAGSGVTTLGIPDCAGVSPDVARDTLTANFNDIESVKKLFTQHGKDIAALIVEPIIGNAGFIEPQADFLQQLREITLAYESLLIFDEVMTGFRVNLSGAQGLYRVKPDLTMLGKVIGGGLPVGAFGGRKDIMSRLAPLGDVYQAGTLSGNPLAMSAGLATLKEWSNPEVFETTSKNAKVIVDALNQSSTKSGVPLNAKSIGTMFGFFFQNDIVYNFEDAKKSDLKSFNKFFHAALDSGVYFAPSQFEAGFLSFAHEGATISRTVEVIEEIFSNWN